MIDFAKLESSHNACKGRVRYKLGAKAPSLSCEPTAIQRIDCSGYVRWLLKRVTGETWPEGSQNQLDYSRKHLRKLAKYSDVTYAKADKGRLFIAFLSPKPGAAWPRHVWLVWAGKSLESCSGQGVSSRPYCEV